MTFIKPKEIVIKDLDGDERKFIISRFPAVEGREIIAGYPITAIPKFGDYASNETVMLKLMTYASVINAPVSH